MTFQEYKLSEREQWAQNLQGNIKGMIPLAEHIAITFDAIDRDDLDHFLFNLLASDRPIIPWKKAFDALRELDDAIGEKDFRKTHEYCRRQYKSNEEFTAAKKEMIVSFLMNEYSVTGTEW